jgi:16S rRNA (guanine966-N2)-methyltransferase
MFLKITSGTFRGRKFRVPSSDLRPTSEKVRAAYFNTLFSLIDFDNRLFLDLFSGSGAFAFEALSRGFSSAVSIEKDSICAEQIKKNAAELSVQKEIKVIKTDIYKYNFKLLSEKTKFDAIYIDPPYADGNKMAELIDKIVDSDIIAQNCVFCVEGNSFLNWTGKGWDEKRKKFGDTHLTFIYHLRG